MERASAAAQPANSISITSCGAVADNTPTNGTAAPGATDSTADIQNCINQAASQGKILWIPQGTFYLIGTASLVAKNVTVEGAGYLYSEIYRDVPLPNNTPLGSAVPVLLLPAGELPHRLRRASAAPRSTAAAGPRTPPAPTG